MGYVDDLFLRYYFQNKYTAKNYISNGIVALWDGIENAGFGIHDDTLNTWVDLSGNGNNVKKYGNPVINSNNVDFSQDANAYYDVGSHLGKMQTYTLEVVFDFYGYRPKLYTSPFSCIESGGTGFQFNNNNTNALYYYVGKAGSGYYTAISTTPALNKIISTVLTVGNSQINGFINNEKIGTVTNVSTVRYVDSRPFRIGREVGADASSKSLNGKIYCIRVYDRALTEAEIKFNNAIDKKRFNF